MTVSSDRRGSRPLTLDLGVTRRLVEWREVLETRPTSSLQPVVLAGSRWPGRAVDVLVWPPRR